MVLVMFRSLLVWPLLPGGAIRMAGLSLAWVPGRVSFRQRHQLDGDGAPTNDGRVSTSRDAPTPRAAA